MRLTLCPCVGGRGCCIGAGRAPSVRKGGSEEGHQVSMRRLRLVVEEMGQYRIVREDGIGMTGGVPGAPTC